MKYSLIKLSAAVAVLALAGCGGGTQTNNGQSQPTPAATPAQARSTADVVKLQPEEVSITPGGSTETKVLLTISPGFHVNANPATFNYLIATELTPGKVEGINIAPPVYPAAARKKFQFAEQPLAVYEGDAPIKLNLRAEKNAATGARSVAITVRVQACDEEQCYPPVTLNSAISVTVK